jgi:hypothetical protein
VPAGVPVVSIAARFTRQLNALISATNDIRVSLEFGRLDATLLCGGPVPQGFTPFLWGRLPMRKSTARMILLCLMALSFFGFASPSLADCTSVNGSALNNLAANETVNCTGTSSANLVSTNDDITLNLSPGLSVAVAGNFTDLVDGNIIQGSDFFVLSGGTALLAQDGNSIKLSDGYLSGDMFAIDIEDGNEVWLTDMGLVSSAGTAMVVGDVTYMVFTRSSFEAANIGVELGNDSRITGTDITIEAGGQGIVAGDDAIVKLTDSQLTTGTDAITVGSGGDVQLTNTDIVSSQKGIVVGDGSQIILLDVSIDSTQGGITGLAGFALITSSEIAGGTQAAIAKNGQTTVIDSVLTGTDGFSVNDATQSATLILTGTTIDASSNSVLMGNVGDTLILNSGNNLNSVNGADGGTGPDQLLLQGTGDEDEVFSNFEDLTMDGEDWSLSGTSIFADLTVQSGRLRINGDIEATNSAVVLADAVIGGSGNLTTPLLDVTDGGVAPGNSVGTLTVTGNFSLNGGFMEVEFDDSGIDLLAVTGTATLTGSPTLIVSPLSGAGGAAGAFLIADGGLTGTFGEIDFNGNGGATVTYTANSALLFAAQPTGSVAEEAVVLGLGEKVMGLLGNEQLAHLGDNERRIWGTGIGLQGERDAINGNAAYEYKAAGTMVGSDLFAADGWRFGVGAGYGHADIDVDDSAGDSNLDGGVGLAYGSYERDTWFVLGRVMGGWQDIDNSRSIATVTEGTSALGLPITISSIGDATSESDAWLIGAGTSVGANLPFEGGWKLTPRFNLEYVQQWHGKAREDGSTGGEITIDGYSTAALTASAQLRVGRTVDFTGFSIEPFVQGGVAQRVALGDRATDAHFQETDDSFALALEHEDWTMGLVDVGTVLDFQNGVEAQLSYGGQFMADGDAHSLMATIRATW